MGIKNYYYKVALLRSSAPELTYVFSREILVGSVVWVPLKTSKKEAVVLACVEQPEFETQEIVSVEEKSFSRAQMQLAKFISEYYFSSFSEAISLFLPFCRSGCLYPDNNRDTLNKPNKNRGIEIPRPSLSSSQQKAYAQILQKEKSLLFGVTGSGKTEIFICLMAEMLKEGKSSIFLMPEISLTPQMEKRLKVYFEGRVAMWHSKLTKKKKESILKEIEEGKICIVAGARSALFVPLKNVGLIVVDEEHDDSYKAMTRPRYHARDVAVLMGAKLGAKVLLASATPSMASYAKYDVVKLDKPYVESKKHYTFLAGDSINHTILNALHRHYKEQNQSLLFLPTRGNFKYLYCEGCGKTHLCPYCSVGMALHRKFKHLKCHYCNFTQAIVDRCTYCGYAPLKNDRMGTVEAIEVIEEAIDGIVVEQFDKDSITTTKRLKEALHRFETKQSHILLGTQMLSKGHDYANITLSVIMGLDYILGLADYRARERAMSLLFQIAGRSGRAKEAEVLVQTGDPEFFQNYLDDYETFIKDELAFLEMAEYPPFVSLARILISHKEEAKAAKITLDTVTKLKAFDTVEIVGSGKAPVERIANKYRFTILLRSKKRLPLLKALHAVDCRAIEIDMDPVEFS